MAQTLALRPAASAAAFKLISARQIQDDLGIGSTTLYKWCRQGKLTPIKFGPRCTRFRLSEMEALITAHASKGAAA